MVHLGYSLLFTEQLSRIDDAEMNTLWGFIGLRTGSKGAGWEAPGTEAFSVEKRAGEDACATLGGEFRRFAGVLELLFGLAEGAAAHHHPRDDHTLKVWDLETGLPLAPFHCDAGARCCAFAGD
jgi:hypothetical protein